jgi:hypothetical protein
MKVRFTRQRGVSLPIELLSLGYTPESEFDLVTGDEYTVYGIALQGANLHYLVIPKEQSRANWYPAIFFTMLDGRLPYSWEFDFNPDPPGCTAIAVWGYKELVEPSRVHYRDLLNRDAHALGIFAQRRKQLDAES